MVLRNTMGINYNTLATLAGSKPWRLFFAFLFFFSLEFERAFVGPFPDSAVYPIVYKRKKEDETKGRLSYSAIGERYNRKEKQTENQRPISLSGMNVFMTRMRKITLFPTHERLLKIPHTDRNALIGIVIAMSGLHRISFRGKYSRRSFPRQKPRSSCSRTYLARILEGDLAIGA